MTELAFSQLREYVIEATKLIKARLAETNERSFRLDIEVSGRVDGNARIEFRLGESYGDGVTGGDIEKVLDEYLRRVGWSRQNNPLLLSNTGETSTAEAEDL